SRAAYGERKGGQSKGPANSPNEKRGRFRAPSSLDRFKCSGGRFGRTAAARRRLLGSCGGLRSRLAAGGTAEADLLGKAGPGRGIIRRDHRIVTGKSPLGAIFGRGQIVGAGEVA